MQILQYIYGSSSDSLRVTCELISWCRTFVENSTLLTWTRNSPLFMEHRSHYHAYKGSPLHPILCKLNPVYVCRLYCSKAKFNIIFTSRSRSRKRFFSLQVFRLKCYMYSYFSSLPACYIPRLRHLPSFNYPNNIC